MWRLLPLIRAPFTTDRAPFALILRLLNNLNEMAADIFFCGNIRSAKKYFEAHNNFIPMQIYRRTFARRLPGELSGSQMELWRPGTRTRKSGRRHIIAAAGGFKVWY